MQNFKPLGQPLLWELRWGFLFLFLFLFLLLRESKVNSQVSPGIGVCWTPQGKPDSYNHSLDTKVSKTENPRGMWERNHWAKTNMRLSGPTYTTCRCCKWRSWDPHSTLASQPRTKKGGYKIPRRTINNDIPQLSIFRQSSDPKLHARDRNRDKLPKLINVISG